MKIIIILNWLIKAMEWISVLKKVWICHFSLTKHKNNQIEIIKDRLIYPVLNFYHEIKRMNFKMNDYNIYAFRIIYI